MGLGSLSPGYSSGEDISLEAQGVRFDFGWDDFRARVRAAALRLGLGGAEDGEAIDDETLARLAIDGLPSEDGPLPALIARVAGPGIEGVDSVVHWLRRLVFRDAWIDRGVSDGVLVPEFTQGAGFRYRSAATGMYTADGPPLPHWAPPGAGSA